MHFLVRTSSPSYVWFHRKDGGFREDGGSLVPLCGMSCCDEKGNILCALELKPICVAKLRSNIVGLLFCTFE